MKNKCETFNLTLEECKKILDSISGLIVVDNDNVIRYLSPDMLERISAITGVSASDQVIGKNIEEIHPISKIPLAIKENFKDKFYFYFTYGETNISLTKPLYDGEKLKGAIDFDIINGDIELRSLVESIFRYSDMGYIDIAESLDDLVNKQERRIANKKYLITDILGSSESILRIKQQIVNVATSLSTVLISGPTGSGKELVAHAIHNLSNRKHIVEVNCAAIPESLVESELFGYDDGTFTGAKRGGKKGKFEMADSGTIFLDEIDQLGYYIQPKLLRVLQEKKVTRIGGSVVPVDIRVIAATNKNLKELVNEGKFREDLYYRLNVDEIKNPSLAERKEDIPELAYKHIHHLNRLLDKDVTVLSNEVLELFYSYDWPGNIRELNNIIERAMTECRGKELDIQYFKELFSDSIAVKKEWETSFAHSGSPLNYVRDKAEKEAILKALELCGQNRMKTARFLKISKSNLYNKMEKYNIL